MKAPSAYEPGARVEGGIPLCVPQIAGNEWRYVKECLDSGWVSSVGAFVNKFEELLAARCDVAHAVAASTGTAALHTALLLAGVAADDEVLVSTLTFIAPVNAIRYVGAHPVLIDAEARYWQMDPALVEEFLSVECSYDGTTVRNRASGRRVAAILPVDVLGTPVDFDAIATVARRFNLKIVHDVTESLGARYKGRHVGSNSDLACLSFNGNKLITTGGGGAILTNDAHLATRARYLTTQAKDDPVEYVHGTVGYNYRLTNVQAAIGVAQLEVLDAYIERKRTNASRYSELLASVPGIAPMCEPPYAESTFWMYTILVDQAQYGRSSRDLLRALGEHNVQARPLWQPMHRSPAHAGARAIGGAVADRLHRDALSLPSSVGLTDQELGFVADLIHRYRST